MEELFAIITVHRATLLKMGMENGVNHLKNLMWDGDFSKRPLIISNFLPKKLSCTSSGTNLRDELATLRIGV